MSFCPASPWLPKFTLDAFVCRAIARLFCAVVNSFRKPFSKMLTSFRFTCRQFFTAWLPV